MGNLLFCAPNFIEDTVEPPIVGGGGWEVDYPVSNLGAEFFADNTISTDLTSSNLVMQFDLTFPRDIKFIGIPGGNISLDGQIQIKMSRNRAWSGVTIDGVNAINATTLNILTASAITITAGDIFKIAGDDTVYQVVTGGSFSASGSGSITIKRDAISGSGLVAATTGNEAVTCHTGDYTSAPVDTGFIDYFTPIIPFGSPAWGGAGLYDGKAPESFYQKLNLPEQFIYILDDLEVVQFIEISFSDSSNPAGYLSVDALYLTSVYQPTYNMLYGADFGDITNTSKESSSGGASAFTREKPTRTLTLNLANIPVEEAFTSLYDTTRELDISGNMYVVYDDTDTLLAIRRTFPARFESGVRLTAQAFNSIGSSHTLVERLA